MSGASQVAEAPSRACLRGNLSGENSGPGAYQSIGPLSPNCCTRKSMKARTLGWVKRPGG